MDKVQNKSGEEAGNAKADWGVIGSVFVIGALALWGFLHSSLPEKLAARMDGVISAAVDTIGREEITQ